MNAYFFNITNEERSNILDKHKEIYDGYVTQYAKPNEQALYTQDFANDKNGITVNNKGEVGEYRNMNINEMKYDGKDTGLFSDEVTEDVFSGAKFEPEETFEEIDEMQLDTIGDGPLDLENGTVDFDNNDDIFDELEDDMVEPLQEQLNRTIDMFNRFKKY
jgi:lysine/ornithine N-monooxygenase